MPRWPVMHFTKQLCMSPCSSQTEQELPEPFLGELTWQGSYYHPIHGVPGSVCTHHGPMEAPGHRSEALPLCHPGGRGDAGAGGDQDGYQEAVCKEGERHGMAGRVWGLSWVDWNKRVRGCGITKSSPRRGHEASVSDHNLRPLRSEIVTCQPCGSHVCCHT